MTATHIRGDAIPMVVAPWPGEKFRQLRAWPNLRAGGGL
jgi:hypothetical protein